MRIAHVVHYFLPRHLAGVEIYTFHLARAQSARHRVSVFTREDGSPPGSMPDETLTVGGLSVHRVYADRPGDFDATLFNEEVERSFERFLDDETPDVVHVQHLDRLSTRIVELATARAIPVVLTLHDYWFLCPQTQMIRDDTGPCAGPREGRACARCPNVAAESLRHGVLPRLEQHGGALAFATRFARTMATRSDAPAWRRLTRRLEGRSIATWLDDETTSSRYRRLRELLSRVDVVVSPSRFLLDTLRRHGMAARPVELLDYGIPLDGWLPPPATPRSPMRFGYLSTIVPHKGIEVALEAFARIEPADAELQIRAWGPSDYAGWLQRRYADRPNIRFLEPFPPEEVHRVFHDLDVLVFPSLWYENAPIVLHEAAAAGVPVVASNFGAVSEFVTEGANGLLFRRGSASDLRRRVRELVARPERLASLRRAPFPLKSIEENAAELEAIYEAALRKRTAKAASSR